VSITINKTYFEEFPGYTEDAFQLLIRHLKMVMEANKTVNITSIQSFEKAVYLHLYDSLLGLGALGKAHDGKLLDIGSGAGYPGVPLSIFNSREAVLIDSVKKKADVLYSFVKELGLGNQIAVKAVRAEEEARANREQYTAVCVRAVGHIVSMMELAAPLLENNGVLVVYKGPGYAQEMSSIDVAEEAFGMHVESIEEFLIPIEEAQRTIIMIRKTDEARISLPRTDGRAQKKPLI